MCHLDSEKIFFVKCGRFFKKKQINHFLLTTNKGNINYDWKNQKYSPRTA